MGKVWLEGTVRNGQVVLAAPLDLPDGTEVELTVREPAPEESPSPETDASAALTGMWAHRSEMADAEAWVRRLR